MGYILWYRVSQKGFKFMGSLLCTRVSHKYFKIMGYILWYRVSQKSFKVPYSVRCTGCLRKVFRPHYRKNTLFMLQINWIVKKKKKIGFDLFIQINRDPVKTETGVYIFVKFTRFLQFSSWLTINGCFGFRGLVKLIKIHFLSNI